MQFSFSIQGAKPMISLITLPRHILKIIRLLHWETAIMELQVTHTTWLVLVLGLRRLPKETPSKDWRGLTFIEMLITLLSLSSRMQNNSLIAILMGKLLDFGLSLSWGLVESFLFKNHTSNPYIKLSKGWADCIFRTKYKRDSGESVNRFGDSNGIK
jgi:hypothetical protein